MVGNALVGMAVQRGLEVLVVVMGLRVVHVLVRGDRQGRHPGHAPQQCAHGDNTNEISSHEQGVSHRFGNTSIPECLPGLSDRFPEFETSVLDGAGGGVTDALRAS